MTVRKLESGKWQAIVRKTGFRARSETFDTKRQADAWKARTVADIDGSRTGEGARKRVHELFDYFKTKVSPSRKGERWEKVRLTALVRTMDFASHWLEDVHSDHCQEWIDKRLTEVSAGTVLREIALIQSVWGVGLKPLRWVRANPWKDVIKPKQPKPRTRRPTQPEIDAFVSASGYRIGGVPANKTQATVATFLLEIETTMRSSEICGLCPEHYDVARKTVMLPDTKNGESREVPLSPLAISIIEGVMKARHKGDEPIFGLKPDYRDALYRKLRARIARDMPSVATLRFHDGRREGSTRLARLLPVMDLAKVTGHKDIRILNTVYYSPDMSEMANRLVPVQLPALPAPPEDS